MTTSDSVNPITGEVTLAPDSVREEFFEEWERGLLVLWKGNMDVAFSYESTTSGIKERLIVMSRVLAKTKNAIYIGGVYPNTKMFKTFLIDRIRSEVRHPEGISNIPDFLLTLGVDLASLPNLPEENAKKPSRRGGPDVLSILNDALAIQEHNEFLAFKAKRLGEVELLLKKSVLSKNYELFLIGEMLPQKDVICLPLFSITGKISAKGKAWQMKTFVRDVLGYPVE